MEHPSPKYTAEFKQGPCSCTARGKRPTRRSPGSSALTRRALPTGSDAAQTAPGDNPFKIAEEIRKLRREVERLGRENEIII